MLCNGGAKSYFVIHQPWHSRVSFRHTPACVYTCRPPTRVTYILAFHMALERYRQHGAVTGNGRNNWATSLNCRPIRPSARRKWNGMEWNMELILRRNRYAVLHTPSGVHALSRNMPADSERRARTKLGEERRENSVEPNHRTHGGIARMSGFKLPLTESCTLSVSRSDSGWPTVAGLTRMNIILEGTRNESLRLAPTSKTTPFHPRASPRLSIRYWLWMQILIMWACLSKIPTCRNYDVDDVHLTSPERLSWPEHVPELSKIVK